MTDLHIQKVLLVLNEVDPLEAYFPDIEEALDKLHLLGKQDFVLMPHPANSISYVCCILLYINLLCKRYPYLDGAMVSENDVSYFRRGVKSAQFHREVNEIVKGELNKLVGIVSKILKSEGLSVKRSDLDSVDEVVESLSTYAEFAKGDLDNVFLFSESPREDGGSNPSFGEGGVFQPIVRKPIVSGGSGELGSNPKLLSPGTRRKSASLPLLHFAAIRQQRGKAKTFLKWIEGTCTKIERLTKSVHDKDCRGGGSEGAFEHAGKRHMEELLLAAAQPVSGKIKEVASARALGESGGSPTRMLAAFGVTSDRDVCPMAVVKKMELVLGNDNKKSENIVEEELPGQINEEPLSDAGGDPSVKTRSVTQTEEPVNLPTSQGCWDTLRAAFKKTRCFGSHNIEAYQKENEEGSSGRQTPC